MSDIVISEIKRDHIVKLLKDGKREDGRRFTDYRDISYVTNCIESADGSARVKLGKTEVIAGVKIIPGHPEGRSPHHRNGIPADGAPIIRERSARRGCDRARTCR